MSPALLSPILDWPALRASALRHAVLCEALEEPLKSSVQPRRRFQQLVSPAGSCGRALGGCG